MKYRTYLLLIIFLLIASINFNLFLKPLHLVCGGTQGIAIILHEFMSLSYSNIILIINIIMLLLSTIFLNKKTTFGTLLATLIYPFFVKLTSFINIEISSIVINIILSGIFSGITNGFIYKLGFTAGGISLISPIINKYTNISIGIIHFFINFIILLLDLLLFGIKNFFYSFIVILLNSFTIQIILFKKKIM